MKTLYRNDQFQLVDNEQDYDFVGWIENFTDKTLVVVFIPGELNYDEDSDEDYYDEDGWEVEEIVFCDENELDRKREFVEENNSYPNFTTMIEIEPGEWGGFLADNRERSMFNALQVHCQK